MPEKFINMLDCLYYAQSCASKKITQPQSDVDADTQLDSLRMCTWPSFSEMSTPDKQPQVQNCKKYFVFGHFDVKFFGHHWPISLVELCLIILCSAISFFESKAGEFNKTDKRQVADHILLTKMSQIFFSFFGKKTLLY